MERGEIMQIFIREIKPEVELCKDDTTGISWAEALCGQRFQELPSGNNGVGD